MQAFNIWQWFQIQVEWERNKQKKKQPEQDNLNQAKLPLWKHLAQTITQGTQNWRQKSWKQYPYLAITAISK